MFATFIIALIVAFIVWPLVRVWLAMRRMQKAAGQAQQQFRRQAEQQRRANRPGGWSKPRRKPRGKKISPLEGEYVEFEEMTVTEEQRSADSGQPTTVRTEQQIVDVEWEDIKP